MLVLSLQPDQKILIETSDGPIEVMLTALRGDKARLGFTAAKCVKINREKVVDRIKAENAAAAKVQTEGGSK
jgi:carbon storage regulator CsrA